jgi:hypothetical protein
MSRPVSRKAHGIQWLKQRDTLWDSVSRDCTRFSQVFPDLQIHHGVSFYMRPLWEIHWRYFILRRAADDGCSEQCRSKEITACRNEINASKLWLIASQLKEVTPETNRLEIPNRKDENLMKLWPNGWHAIPVDWFI